MLMLPTVSTAPGPKMSGGAAGRARLKPGPSMGPGRGCARSWLSTARRPSASTGSSVFAHASGTASNVTSSASPTARRVWIELICGVPLRSESGGTMLEGDIDPHAHRPAFLEHARVVHGDPVQDVVTVDVLQVGAAGAAGLGEVDGVLVTGLADERVEPVGE